MSEPEVESVEVQVGDGGDPNRVFVFQTIPVEENKLNLLVKCASGNDDSTARTENSTEDESSLRERFSFGSLSLTESAETFHSHGSKVDAARQLWRARLDQGNLYSIGEAKIQEFQKNSLFDLDLSDDDLDTTTPGIKLTTDNRVDSLYSESRAEFYRGYSLGTFVGEKSHTREGSESSKSTFVPILLNTDSRVGFYRVSSSALEEPLSCREKLDQVCHTCVIAEYSRGCDNIIHIDTPPPPPPHSPRLVAMMGFGTKIIRGHLHRAR
jgi:hypothetical protein